MSAGKFLSLAALSMLGAACDGGCGREQSGDAGPVLSLSDLLPLRPGNRWRMVAEPGGAVRNYGITAVENGVGVFHGTAHTYAERMTLRDDAIQLVSPDGHVLATLLRGPAKDGTEWRYALQERDLAIPCRGRITATGRTYELRLSQTGQSQLGGSRVEGCVATTRRCDYPAGSPFPRPTKHDIEDLWCEGVGLVQRTQRFDPAPPFDALPARRTERLVGFAVAGTSWGSEAPFDCGRFIVLPSDVRAACGPEFQVSEPFAGVTTDGTCRYVFEKGGAKIVIEASEGRLGEVAPASDTVLSLARGDIAIRVSQDPEACPPDRLGRLEPLLLSLIK